MSPKNLKGTAIFCYMNENFQKQTTPTTAPKITAELQKQGFFILDGEFEEMIAKTGAKCLHEGFECKISKKDFFYNKKHQSSLHKQWKRVKYDKLKQAVSTTIADKKNIEFHRIFDT